MAETYCCLTDGGYGAGPSFPENCGSEGLKPVAAWRYNFIFRNNSNLNAILIIFRLFL